MSTLGPLGKYEPINDWTPYIRDYKIALVTGEKEIGINENCLDYFKKELKFIKDNFPNDILTGSLALNIYGLINRNISDIDILIEDDNRYSGYNKTLYGYSNDEADNRLGYRYIKHRYGLFNLLSKEYVVDFFKKEEGMNTFSFEYDNHTYVLEHPISIIEKKANFNSRKSYRDLHNIFVGWFHED
jgi:hypothetical protein